MIQKTNKFCLHTYLFLYIKMTNNYYQKDKKKSFKKKHVKDIKILKKKEKEKKRQYHRERNLIYSTFQRQVEYMRNYYLTHQK